MKHPHLATLARMLAVGAVLLLGGCSLELLSPKGEVGAQEKVLLLTATGLMLLIVVPVIFMTIWFVWKYRASNTEAEYLPTWSHSGRIEFVVWTIPCIIIIILAVITWRSTHALDPYKPLESDVKPVTIEVVSMDWKWLFIYPEYDIATVNQIVFPVNTPLNFRITSNSVMNSFFIPQLGSQIYSMAGMETKLHLIANEEGDYAGLSANYSGGGFSGMRFRAIATSQQKFEDWVKQAKDSGQALTPAVYDALAKPSERNPVTLYSDVPAGMFDFIMHNQMSKMAGVDPATCTPVTKNLIAVAE
ncbi:ubiquinol oxidase subunit II [Bordetella trematum]|uniref:ubiquinol oxidase subunit II n=1 Tax=Bordetella trematum TaxID=123899 RepID=UPI000DE59A18|nr:ubiquinol oxidase subunit II [Bordetella trematum]